MDLVLRLLFTTITYKFIAASCPSNSIEFIPRGICYQLIKTPANFEGAKTGCEDLDGNLARIKSQETQDFLFQNYAGKFFWMGLSDSDNNNVYTWVDNSDLVYQNWNETLYVPAYCALFSKTGKWTFTNCIQTKYYLCEVPKVTVTTESDGILYHVQRNQILYDMSFFSSSDAVNNLMCAQSCINHKDICAGFTFDPETNIQNCRIYQHSYGNDNNFTTTTLLVYKVFS
ncbi:hypothetical protein SNE40_015986 [Patella caerulea]|uniref:C-type lectin domain-containing protein n=1 Tax=Patella caerulea TaxID=87958 RepID=A0AAN8JA18_PATCE